MCCPIKLDRERAENKEVLDPLSRVLKVLEPCEGKLSRTVLRRGDLGNEISLSDGAVIVVATATVIIAVVATSSAGAAAAAAGAAGVASSSKSDREEKSGPSQTESSDLARFEDTLDLVEATSEAPTVKATIDDHVSLFRECVSEDVIIQSSDVHRDLSFGEKGRELGAFLAHETLEGISEIASIVPHLEQEICDLGSKILPENAHPPSDNPFIGNTKANYETFIAKSHEAIDWVFSTEQADQYTPEAKTNDPMNAFAIGLIPPPGNFSRGLSVSKFRQIIEAGKETVVLAEELGFTAREIMHLEKNGILEETIKSTYNNLVNKPEMLKSFETFKNAETFLKPYLGKYLPEASVRELIHEAGIKTFPKPAGIPKNFRVKLSNDGAGMKYVHPKHEETYVRVMPGKPYSPNPKQRQPYVVRMKDGKTYDKFGNVVSRKSPEAHIPIKDFVYRD